MVAPSRSHDESPAVFLLLLAAFFLGSTLSTDGGTVVDALKSLTGLVEKFYAVGSAAYVLLLCRRHWLVARSDGTEDSASEKGGGGGGGSSPGSYVVVTPPESFNGDDSQSVADDDEDDQSVVNLSGTYKLTKNVDFDKFLESQGVGWALRRAADKAKPVHRITHRGRTVRIQISGIITGDTTYRVGGPPVQSQIRDRVFEDTVTYLESRDGIRVKKIAKKEKYRIMVTRQLSSDRSELMMRSKAIFDDGRESAEAVQTFTRVS